MRKAVIIYENWNENVKIGKHEGKFDCSISFAYQDRKIFNGIAPNGTVACYREIVSGNSPDSENRTGYSAFTRRNSEILLL